MRKLTLFLASFLMVFVAFGQNIVQKSTIQQYQTNEVAKATTNQLSDEERYALLPKTPSGHIRCIVPTYNQPEAQFESWISEKITEINLSNNFAAKASRNIPVVVHILHNGDAVGSGENISIAQIQSQIDIMNEDFSATNADISGVPGAFAGDVADSDIQFCLARTDPTGNATNGIDRINVGVTSVSDTDIETNYGLNNMWDPTKYLNIFVGNLTGGLLGKAVFPTGSGLSGMPGGGAPSYDGVMILYSSFGDVGSVSAPYNLGRTATHEIGHWLGLRHIWGDSNCGNDFCNDTPTQQTDNGGCPTYPSITCGNSGDMSMNYMDYTNDACMYMFTNDQKTRMDAVLANSPQRVELLSSNRCQPPAISADFIADFTTINVGGSVNFTDLSVSPDNLNSWVWAFPGGTPNSFIGQTPPAIVYAAQGTYDVTLTVGDDNAGSDAMTKTNYINVVVAGVCDTLNNPPAGTVVTYTSAEGYLAGWNEYGDVSKAEFVAGEPTYPYITGGLFGIRSANDGGNGATVDFNVWDNTGAAGAPGAILATVTVDLADLDFNVGYENTLVEIMFPTAVNVGTSDYYFGFTMNGFQATDTLGMFSNTDADSSPGTAWEQWSDLSWNTFVTGWGVNVTQYIAPYRSQNAPTATIVTNTTSICAGETVDFDASTSIDANTYDWVFNSGAPTSSTNITETVTYATAGTPRAYLIAYGNCGAIAVDSVDVTVNAPTTPTFTQVAAICAGDALTLPTTSDNAITGTWSPAVDNMNTTMYTFTPTAGICATATTTMTVTVNSVVTPTFTQVAAICAGDVLTLPTTSDNAITGTWSPAEDNMNTTMYTFTPTAGQCATATTTMTVTVNTPVTPTFTQVAAICAGETLSLPTTSDNAITGTWSPAVDNMNTTLYTFTPSAGECATATTTMTVTVNAATTPTFTQIAAICAGDVLTLPTTSDNAITGTWSPAVDNMNTTMYTFTPSAGQCASATTTMTVTVNAPITPTFTQVSAICAGDALSALPTTSDNAITGTWSPAVDNMNTTMYTFTPTAGQCATQTTMTITVNSTPTTPTFTQVAAICEGDALTLPTTSDNAITGTWSPAVDNMNTTMYTFTPTAGQCATGATTMTVTVNTPITPTFTQVAAICAGDVLTLPTTSDNAITGTWSPAVDNMNTTMYTFTPTAGQCASATTTMTVTVNAGTTPTFTQVAAICAGDALSALPLISDNGITGTWSPALDNMNTTTYTFTPAGGQCAGQTTMVITVNTCVGIEEIDNASVLIYPNPATEVLTIETSNVEVKEVKLINILGETLVTKVVNSSTVNVNVSEFPMGVYFVQLLDNKGQVILTEKVSVK